MDSLRFEPVAEHIELLRVPFEGIYTAVFLIDTEQGAAVLDAACAGDGDNVILPALAERGVVPAAIFLTHDHRDHAGGAKELAAAFPGAEICSGTPEIAQDTGLPVRLLQDGDTILGPLRAYALPGHTANSAGLFDTRTGTLLTGDALQLYGVGKFGLGAAHIAAYYKTLSRVADDPGVRCLLTSHDFFPLGARADGREAIRAYTKACRDALDDVAAFVSKHPETDPKELRSLYISAYPDRPPVPQYVFKRLMIALEGCTMRRPIP